MQHRLQSDLEKAKFSNSPTAAKFEHNTPEGALFGYGNFSPTSGSSGTGAGVAAPGCLFINTSGSGEFVSFNTGTKANPTWAANVAAGAGPGSGSGDATTFSGDIVVESMMNLIFGTQEAPHLDGAAAMTWDETDVSNPTLVLGLGEDNQTLHITDLGAKNTDWNIAAHTHPTVYIHSDTTPITDYISIGNHNGTTAAINMVGGTGLDIQIDSVGAIRLDDAAVASFTAATGTAGKAVFIETQDGGAAATDTNGVAGGALSWKTGDGSIPNGSGTTGGAGGAATYATGAGAAGGATGTGGAGGAMTISTGAGGSTSGAGTGGAGGALNLTTGAGGTTSGGTNGAAGIVAVSPGGSEKWRFDGTGNLTSGGGVPANVTADGAIIATGGIAMTDVLNAWIDDATHGSGTTTHYIGNQTITTSSDIRVKKNVSAWRGDALDFLRSAPQQVEFTYNLPGGGGESDGDGPNSRGRYRGWIAQETIDWAPWVVNAGNAANCPTCRAGQACDEHRHYWHVEYQHLVPMLVQAINELRDRVEELEGAA